MISQRADPDQVREGPYVSPSVAHALTKFNSFEIRNLTTTLDGVAPVRSIHDRGRLLIHIGDLLGLSAVATPIAYPGGDPR